MIGRILIFSLLVATLSTGSATARCQDHVPQPKPQNASRDIVSSDLDTIIERGYIEFAAYEDFPPWSYEQDGKIQGVDIDIGRLIAEDLEVEARFKLVTAGENLEADLRNWIWKGPLINGSVANVMLHIPYDSEFACRVEQVFLPVGIITKRLRLPTAGMFILTTRQSRPISGLIRLLSRTIR